MQIGVVSLTINYFNYICNLKSVVVKRTARQGEIRFISNFNQIFSTIGFNIFIGNHTKDRALYSQGAAWRAIFLNTWREDKMIMLCALIKFSKQNDLEI